MRPLLLTLITVAALAAAPSSALSKGAIGAQVCGADGCTDVPRDEPGGMLAQGHPTQPPQAAAPFAEIRLTVIAGPHGKTDRVAFDYLPSLGVTRTHDGAAGWVKLQPAWRTALNEALGATKLRSASELARLAGLPNPNPNSNHDTGSRSSLPWWAITGAALALLALLTRYSTSALKARPRASKSAN
ncbi:MAG: hypothetical protein QOF69_3231 [Solirubrobacteraceae bacterium]|nr:hypothetical protein [Solirubrobacteraceae bacterium]